MGDSVEEVIYELASFPLWFQLMLLAGCLIIVDFVFELAKALGGK